MASAKKFVGGGSRLAMFVILGAFVLGAGSLLTARPAYAASAVIKDIQVEGNRRVEPETVRSYLQFAVGDAYDAYAVDQSLKALFATGLFSDVKIDRNGATVVVTIVENPIINRISFEGNAEVEDATLETEIQLKPRSVFTRARVQSDVQRVQDVYKRQGLFAAAVTPKIIELDQNRVDLVFEITEGPTTKVQAINFVGNKAFTDSELRGIISTSQTNFFSFLKPTDVYDPDRLNLDRELLRQYYLKNGYADVEIVSAMADLDPNGQGFFITFTVNEGEVYTFGNVALESNISDVDVARVQSKITTTAGEVYNAQKLEKSIEAMTIETASEGFAFAQIKPRVERDSVGRTISVVYTVEEGPKVYIERINIAGNTRTKDYVIRREFKLVEGDAFNKLMVQRAKQRVQDLGFFKAVEIGAEPGSANDRVIITLTVTEQSTGELSFGGGYSSSEGVIGDITLKERNLLGNGQFVQLKLSGSAKRIQVDFSFTEPRFLDQDLSAGVDLFSKTVDASKTSHYKSDKLGGALRLGTAISDESYFTGRYSFVYDDISVSQADIDAGIVSRAIVESAKKNDGQSYTSALGYTINYDTRNNKNKPSRGYYLELAQDVAGLGGDVYYVRTVAEGRAYYPIADKITFVGRITGGAIEGWNGEDVRLLDLFYKGGETIRGFRPSGYGPRDGTTDALGGKFFYAATAEVRFPIPLLPEELGLSAAVFADAGSLFGASDLAKQLDASGDVKLNDSSKLRSSVGGSLIWDSPVGPLRADFAYVLSKEDFDKTEWFRFGASTRF